MDIVSTDGFDFLSGAAPAGSEYPIKVIKAARQRLEIIRAIPELEHLSAWKSLDYKADGKSAADTGSVHVIDDWRMGIFVIERDPPQLSVNNLWRLSDAA